MIITDKFVFVATPRTGSRSISDVLHAHGYETTEDHHTTPELVLEKKSNLPVYSVYRNPRDIIVSWYCKVSPNRNITLESFCSGESGVSPPLMDPMMMYMDISDRAFNFDDGIESIIKAMGVQYDGVIPHVGGDKTRPVKWTEEAEDLAQRKWRKDFEYYAEANL